MAAKSGRPRSETSRQAILEAALRLARTRSYANVTLESIALEAGSGKQTIYRWWPSKAAVVLEALREEARAEGEAPDTGSLPRDLEEYLSNTFAMSRRRRGLAEVLCALMAEAQLDATFAEQFRRDLIEPRRAIVASLFSRAQERGDLAADADVDLCVDAVFGVLWYRLLLDIGPLDQLLARQLAEWVARSPPRSPLRPRDAAVAAANRGR